MYIDLIFQGINFIAEQKFNNGTILLDDDDASFFLEELNKFRGLLTPRIPFESTKWLVPTLILKQTAWNSCGDRVSPRFVECLKASSLAYLVQLSCGWIESLERDFYEERILNLNEDDKSFVSRYTQNDSTYDFGMGDSHCILQYIRGKYAFPRLMISGTSSGDYIYGKMEELQRFLKILKTESPTPPSFKAMQLAKLDRKCNFAVLPIEIVDLIAKTYFEYTFNNPLKEG